MKRYKRISETCIYDRQRQRYIEVRTEKLIGNLYHINANDGDEAIISRGNIDEPRN